MKNGFQYCFLVLAVALLTFLSSSTTVYAYTEDETKLDSRCRSLDVDASPPAATADIIVIGSGPGGTGFLHRLLEQTTPESVSILWIEQGRDFLAKNWPEDLIQEDQPILTTIQRRKLTSMGPSFAWNLFGGGDAGNSGGPNWSGLVQKDEDEKFKDEIFALRSNSITPLTTTSERWMQAFGESDYEVLADDPLYERTSDLSNQIGRVSTLRSENGRERFLLADQIRSDSRVGFVRGRVLSIIHQDGKAVGVRGIQRDDNGSEDEGECVYWRASQAVVLAAGVFNSFDLLIESGIGSQRDLQTRQVPSDWWIVNEHVGTNVGEEFSVNFLSIEPEKQDQLGAEPRLTARNSDDTCLSFWSTSLFEWVQLSNPLLSRAVNSKWFPSRLAERFVDQVGFWAMGIPSGPIMSLVATTSQVQDGLAIELDDSNVVMTEEKCQTIRNALVPLKRGAELQEKAGSRSFLLTWAFYGFQLALRLVEPKVVTTYNADTFAADCALDMLGPYHHYYGGNSDAVDSSYRVIEGLYISDASVIAYLSAGAPAFAVMERGMRVADALKEQLSL